MVSTILELHPLTEHHKNNLKRLAVEKRVEATLKNQGVEHDQLTVECEKLGAVKIKGFVLNETYGKRMCQLAQLCHGVDVVDNRLIGQIPGV